MPHITHSTRSTKPRHHHEPRPRTIFAARLAKRFDLSPAVCDRIADIAGFSGEAR